MKLDQWEKKFLTELVSYAQYQDWFDSDFAKKAGMTETEFDRRYYRLKDKIKNEF
jgi:hypothetical protein